MIAISSEKRCTAAIFAANRDRRLRRGNPLVCCGCLPGKMRIAPRRCGVGNLTHLDQAKRYCLGLA
ncbi:hypothetical protein BZL30_8091 [Mycobacterium kansasii]|uniref:Uncharacterized protein n=1 Tax=Mycobacterium kansasii TaxID=1768 RepID=A0A1V3WHU1_MYCKA|nr:hypothetical protein BZL30_8091 [Mycobacterium kansasii]